MPKPKKSKQAPQGLSPQQVAQANEKGLNTAIDAVPILQFDDMMSNFGTFTDSITDPFTQLFDTLIGRAEDTTGMGPTPEQPVDPYEARLQELMSNRGMTREQAVANQAGAMAAGGDVNNNGAITNNEWAMKLGSDFNNDGTVSNQEFAQWKQQNPDHQAAGGTMHRGLPGENGLFAGQQPQAPQQGPQAQQPQTPPGMAPGQFQGVDITPEQMASIQKFNRYGRGMA